MAKIYTKKGDKGTTDLGEKGEINKSDTLVEVTGSLDELEAQIGNLRSSVKYKSIDSTLRDIQSHLHVLMAQLVGVSGEGPTIKQEHIDFLEEKISEYLSELPKINKFIYSAGSTPACKAHIARTVARRTERRLTSLSGEEEVDKEVKSYMNRLSDFLYTLARYLNMKEGVEEEVVDYGD